MFARKIKILFVVVAAGLSLTAAAQQSAFDHGNNRSYTPFNHFAGPVLQPTPLNAPVTGTPSNREKNLASEAVQGANSGIHFAEGAPGIKTVRYDLYISDTSVNYTGRQRPGIAVNGSIPAPTLAFTVGDTALIYIHNQAAEPTAVHWHGVQLPNRMDGVPFLTQQPIPPHTTYLYKFPVVQSGTYWYHSHFSLQEQVGLYGALIFNKRTEPAIPTIPVVLSDWSNTQPKEIDRMLHTGNDWFSVKKQAVQSYWEALRAGRLGVKLRNEWKRMEAMDVSDVYYERFLLNGDTAQIFSQFRAGGKVRLRVVNGSSSTYFWLTYSGGKMAITANDGNDVQTVEAGRLIIAPSETYDLVVPIPGDRQYEFLATAEDRSGHASLWLGSGMKMPADPLPQLQYFAGMEMMNQMMDMRGNMKPMDMAMSLQKMDMNEVMYPEMSAGSPSPEDTAHSDGLHPAHDGTVESPEENQVEYTCPMHPHIVSGEPGKCPECGMSLVKKETGAAAKDKKGVPILNYNLLKATEETTLPDGPWKELQFELMGNMNRYVWSLNHKTVSEDDKILIRRGENLRIILYNNSMMRHPMHLHGHDFRLINQYGAYSPLKNVVDILPMETDTLEFHASESGDWFFHCHILYHMMSGMGRIFSYRDSRANPEVPHPEKDYKMLKRESRMYYLFFQNDFATNGNDGSLAYANTRWEFQAEWRLGYNAVHGYEVETHFGRYLGKMQWLFPYVGIDWRYRKHARFEKNMFGQQDTKDNRKVLHAGLEYTLPGLIVADAGIDHTGYLRLQLKREDIPLSPRLRTSFMVNTDREFRAGGRYILTKNFSLSAHYDSDMGWGAGIVFTY